jgi:hypothetical protein
MAIDYSLYRNGTYTDSEENPPIPQCTVQVYLTLSTDGNGWVLDGTTTDGESLDLLREPYMSNDDRVPESAELPDTPTAEALLYLLADALGYCLHRNQITEEDIERW